MTKSPAEITIVLTSDEALVLFEWLAREDNKGGLPVEHPSERNVLWKVEGQLEKVLVEPLQPGIRSRSLPRARDWSAMIDNRQQPAPPLAVDPILIVTA